LKRNLRKIFIKTYKNWNTSEIKKGKYS
jgi:hypothetical protein